MLRALSYITKMCPLRASPLKQNEEYRLIWNLKLPQYLNSNYKPNHTLIEHY